MLLSKLARFSLLRIVTLVVVLFGTGGVAAFAQEEVAQLEVTEEPVAEASAEEPALGLDQQVDKLFRPVADAWGSVVFFSVELPGVGPLPLVLILLVGGALFFTIAFGFVNLRLFPLAIEVVSGKFDEIEKQGQDIPKGVEVMEVDGDLVDTIRDEGEGEVSHFQALATAVSGTVGLGNIAGVAVAVAAGGPGATFWMVVCGLLGMSTKFVECTLGVKYRDVDANGVVHGGPMYYLKKGLAERELAPVGKVLGVLFAIFCVGGSFGGGNAFQSNQAAQQIKSLLGLPDTGSSGTIIGLVMAVLVAIVIIGGIKRIAKVTEKVVPLMALMYVVAALGIILMHIQSVPWAIGQVVSGAFSLEAGFGGLLGVMVQGFRRAAFSNEAGAGSAAIAHSAVKTRFPASEGIVALLEPFIDTVVICTMTAIVIVLFNADNSFAWGQVDSATSTVLIDGARMGGVDLTSAAFDSVLPGFRYLLTIAIILFAFSTMISWSYYGLQSWKYLFGRSTAADLSYKLLFCLVVVIGAAVSLGSVIEFSDAMIFAMVFPNMIGLFLLFPKVRQELNAYLEAIGRK
ncbi:alanine/glycine:cation symporter family protein [Rhodopirellula europaea]|uniref:alanine/glycine:cation symporter family protein n=1 Tax=Rhodopirellula europaea TaxID=1263866 RepID=UPI003D2C4117|tara:strand:+ start:30355 stop:32067 length:1713 start_codon:yes stop_codon:yes gene_type:complete